jgi:hypothetical protein
VTQAVIQWLLVLTAASIRNWREHTLKHYETRNTYGDSAKWNCLVRELEELVGNGKWK